MKSKDLAKTLGVSTATVSLLLNNKPGLSAELRYRLITRIKELGLESLLPEAPRGTSVVSTALNSGKKTIAYLVYTSYVSAEDSSSFYPAVLEGVEIEGADRGYDVRVLHMCHDRHCKLIDCLNSTEILGLVVQVEHLTDEIMDELENTELPFVVIDSFRYDRRVSAVCVNNEDGIFNAIKYLADNGHSKIGYVTSGRDTSCFIDRRRCFHLAMREYNVEDRADYRFVSGSLDCGAVQTLIELWKNHPDMPTAIIAENDLLAWRSMKALKKLNYKIPDDISVIGFDDRSIATLMEPPLTTFRVHRQLIGRESVIMLDNQWRLEKSGFNQIPIKLNVGVDFILRETTGPAPKKR